MQIEAKHIVPGDIVRMFAMKADKSEELIITIAAIRQADKSEFSIDDNLLHEYLLALTVTGKKFILWKYNKYLVLNR